MLTVVWHEPITAFTAGREQAKLERTFHSPPKRVLRREPLPGDAIAHIRIPAIDVSRYVVEGTDDEQLDRGPGHYPETPLPGEAGTTAIAGHRTTHGAPFRHIDELERGDRIEIDTPSNRLVYTVQRVKIVNDSDRSILEPAGYSRLVLSACHPVYSATQRVVVVAKEERRLRGCARCKGLQRMTHEIDKNTVRGTPCAREACPEQDKFTNLLRGERTPVLRRCGGALSTVALLRVHD